MRNFTLSRVAKPFFKRPCTGHPNKAVFDRAIVEIAEKLFPSCTDSPRRIGTDVFGDYLLRATWSFEAIGAFGRNLWPFSCSGSGRRSRSSALPWKDIYREETVGT